MEKTTAKTITAYKFYTHPHMDVFILPFRDGLLSKRVMRSGYRVKVEIPDFLEEENGIYLNGHLIRRLKEFTRMEKDSLLHFPTVWKNKSEGTAWVTASNGWQAYLYTEPRWNSSFERSFVFPRLWEFFPMQVFDRHYFRLHPNAKGHSYIVVSDGLTKEKLGVIWWEIAEVWEEYNYDRVFNPLLGQDLPPGANYQYIGEMQLVRNNPNPYLSTVSSLEKFSGIVGGQVITTVSLDLKEDRPIEVYGDLSSLIRMEIPFYYEIFRYTIETDSYIIFKGELNFREIYIFPEKK